MSAQQNISCTGRTSYDELTVRLSLLILYCNHAILSKAETWEHAPATAEKSCTSPFRYPGESPPSTTDLPRARKSLALVTTSTWCPLPVTHPPGVPVEIVVLEVLVIVDFGRCGGPGICSGQKVGIARYEVLASVLP